MIQNDASNPRPYSSYKKSHVPWLGTVPDHWELRRLRGLVQIQTGGKDTVHKKESGKYPFFIRSQTVEKIDTWCHDGEAVLTAGDGAVGEIFHYVNGKFDCHQRVYMFYGFSKMRGKFFFHYLKSTLRHETSQGTAKSTVESLRLPMLQNFPAVVPPLDEQAAIVRYLDDADQQILAYVSAKERLIGLLEEEKQALIQHAVTQGLDPNVRLKPSSVEWLGDVPEHWEVRKLKRVCSQHAQYGANIPASEYTTSGMRFLRTTDITEKGELVGEGVYISPYFSPDHTLNDGDILLTRSGATIGQSFLYQSKKHGPCSYAGYLVRFVPNVEMLPRYIYLFTLTTTFQNSVQQTAITSTIQNVNAEKYANIHLPIPLLNEQIRIVEELDKSTKRIDAAINCASRQIDLINEYRNRLIADVVTGKLDVREAAERLPDPNSEDSLTEHQSLSNPTINATL